MSRSNIQSHPTSPEVESSSPKPPSKGSKTTEAIGDKSHDRLVARTARTLRRKKIPRKRGLPDRMLFEGDCEKILDHWIETEKEPFLDLVMTSPPYNLGKEYEKKTKMTEYLNWQKRIVEKCLKFLKPSGSIVWQVGNYVSNGHIRPLDLELAPIFYDLGLQMRNRVIWSYGHGMHCKKRFSGRYEVALWFTKTDKYIFNLDSVRIPSKWKSKKYFKGPKRGQYSCNPLGKNPEDVWQIPHVNSSHPEKTAHPCQFPLELAHRFVLALTNKNQIVFDPFGGVGTTAAAAALSERRFYSCELDQNYNEIASNRVAEAIHGSLQYREFGKPILEPPE